VFDYTIKTTDQQTTDTGSAISSTLI
jgi:hypothetical protein